MSDPTVASAFLKILKKHGIKHIFGVPTIQIGMMQDGFGRDPWFKYFTTRHEESLGHIASGIAQTSDHMALCFATVGTGVANMLPGVAAAAADHLPLLALTSNNHLRLIEPNVDYMQTIDQLALYDPITKWRGALRQPERTLEVVEKAIYKARIGCPGPVQIDVPFDLHTWACDVDPDSTPVLNVPRPAPSSQDVDQIVDKLLKARRPLLIAGGGVARSGAVETFRTLVRNTGAAAITTVNGYGVLEPNCPTEAGSAGFHGGYGLFKACAEADLILSVGCRFSLAMPVNKPLFPPVEGQEIIQIDIDPNQLGEISRTTMGVVADAGEALKCINDALGKRDLNLDTDWIAALVSERNRYREEVRKIADDETIAGSGILNESAIARAVTEELPDDAIISVDGGQCMEWSLTWFRPKDPYHLAYNPGMGHLGSGLPMAIGAKIANPDKTVAVMAGDGAIGMTIQELETAARYGLNLVVVVYNDAKWGMYERPNRNIFRNENFGTSMSRSNYAEVAQGFGCKGVSVSTQAELRSAVKEACSADAVTVIDVATEYTAHPMDEVWRPMNTAGAHIRPVEI